MAAGGNYFFFLLLFMIIGVFSPAFQAFTLSFLLFVSFLFHFQGYLNGKNTNKPYNNRFESIYSTELLFFFLLSLFHLLLSINVVTIINSIISLL